MKKNASKIFDSKQGKLKSLFNFVSFLFTKPGITFLKRVAKRKLLADKHVDYPTWIKNKLNPASLKQEFDTQYPTLSDKPVISIIIAAANTEQSTLLTATINSVIAQLYPHWELIVVNDNPAGYGDEKRMKAIHINGDTSATGCYNIGLANATGDYVLFLKEGTLLTAHCLFAFAKHITEQPADVIMYADEDRIDETGNFSNPYFKPNWSPDSFLSRNYIGHAFIIKTQLASELKFREDFDSSELFDLLLRATEQTNNIGHIPRVLFHNRQIQPNTTSAKKALTEAMQRRETPASIDEITGLPGMFNINYEIKSFAKVSIIIPTKDQTTLLKTAIDSIINKTTYPDYEIIVLNNNSTSPGFFTLMKEYTERHTGKFRCIDANFQFNYSKLMNLGVAESKGPYILLLNNDIEVIHGDWMTRIVAYTQQPKAGAVGVKLLYPDDTIQHAGIVLGINGDAGHVFVNMPKDTNAHYGSVRTATNYSAVTAACLMCRKELYLAAGGMDETLTVEYNDFDLCLKFLEMDHYNVYIPTELYHHESATRGHPFRSKAAWQQHDKDFTIFKGKWQRYIDNDPFYNPNLSREATDYRLK